MRRVRRAARHSRPGPPAAPRRGGRLELRVLAFGDVQQRRHETAVHRRVGWGADAIFTVAHDTMTFRSYYKLPAPQTSNENCVAHNGSLIPVPGRDIMAQGWYQGGISVFDWTDAAHPREIAYFYRGPMDS